MDTLLVEYEKSRSQIITWFGKFIIFKIFSYFFFKYLIESVKETQRVTVDEIPMPELPIGTPAADVTAPPSTYPDATRGILKQKE
jgi:hypothetical protein